MKDDSGRNRLGYLLGTIHGPDGQPTGKPKEVCVVEMGTGAEICRVPVDQLGRFLLRSEALIGASSDLVELRVLCDRGSLMGRAETSVPRSTAARLRVMLDKPAAVPSRSVIAPPRLVAGPALVAVGTLARMAVALKGRVPERDGRPLVPSWVNASIRELNTLAALGRRVLEGDRAAERAFLRLVGEPGRGFGGASTERPSGAGMPMPFSGRPVLPRSPGAGRGFGGARSFGQPQSGGHPCILDAAGAFVATAAGFMLDRWRADRLGDLTQPGAMTRQTAELIKDLAFALEGFRDEVFDGPIGGMGGFSSPPPLGLGKSPGPDEPLDWPGGEPIPVGGPISPGGPIPPGGPMPGGGPGGGVGIPTPGGAGGFPCGFWVDCVDQIVDAASNYQPPVLCSGEETIGSISPSAVCLGASDVELEIRPVEGESFSSTGVCIVWLQRAFNKRVVLETISASSNLVRVRLKKATFSGYVGFRGAGAGTPGNMAFIDSCFRMAGLLRNPVLDLARTAFNGTQIDGTGRNMLGVVRPPRLEELSVSGPSGAVSNPPFLLIEEACKEVTLKWIFDLGSETEWVDPDDFIRVDVIASDGTAVAQNLPPDGSLKVTAREDESYVIRAESVVNGSTCGQTEGTITVQRVHMLHLTGPASLQVGQSANFTVRSSCPAPAGGLTVSLTSSSPNRLQVPPSALIPEGQDTISVSVIAIGTGCLDVVLIATVPGHLSGSLAIEVFDRPTFDGMTPQTVQSCRTFDLQLSGTCFKAGDTVVSATKAGEATRTLEILEISATTIRCQGTNFPPGSWTVSVRSRGLHSNAFQVLDVQAIPAEIVSFNVTSVESDSPCMNQVWVSWHVKDAVRVVIKKNGTTIHDVELSGCGAVSQGNLSETISWQATCRLEAFPVGGGLPTPFERTVGVSGMRSLVLQNNSSHDLVVWKIEGWYEYATAIPQGLDNKTDLLAGAAITLTFADCVRYQVVAINKPAAINDNKDPYGDAIEINSLWLYHTPFFLGESNGEERWDEIG